MFESCSQTSTHRKGLVPDVVVFYIGARDLASIISQMNVYEWELCNHLS